MMVPSRAGLIHDWVNRREHSIGHLAFGYGILRLSVDGAIFTSSTTAVETVRRSDNKAATALADVRSTATPLSRRLDHPHSPRHRRSRPGNDHHRDETPISAPLLLAHRCASPSAPTHEIWVGDVGWNAFEEINRVKGDRRLAKTSAGPRRRFRRGRGYATPPPAARDTSSSGRTKPYFRLQPQRKVDASSASSRRRLEHTRFVLPSVTSRRRSKRAVLHRLSRRHLRHAQGLAACPTSTRARC